VLPAVDAGPAGEELDPAWAAGGEGFLLVGHCIDEPERVHGQLR